MSYHIKQKVWISIFIFILSHSLFGQNKYQSLLWEIKSPHMEKSSYLYGTMHVSNKLAFHLTDDFFKHIENVDIVALESDPTQWLSENEALDNQPLLNTKRFYRQFQHQILDKYSLAEQLATDHTMINSLLYRSNSALQDFQEDTYLDMFIFQAGSRFNKQIVGLEDFKESRNLVMEAYSEEVVKENQPTWLQDLLKEKGYDMILRDSYRNNDLDMIDSLNSGFSTKHYLNHMLYKRNSNMVEVYDSIVQSGSTIFAGVGAAHLPGDNGMIEMFRAKGYQVTPVYGEWTEIGKKAKNKIENKRINRIFRPYKSSDGFIEFLTPREVHEVSFYGKTMYLAPDLTNGSYVAVSRMKLNHFLNTKIDERLNFEDINKILIEYIPGEIKLKTEIERNGIPGLDITSVTKRGDYHRYAIFKTPLEFIIIKMVGKNEDVKNTSHSLFNSIQFNWSDEWKTIEPRQGGFSVEVPNFYLLDNNNSYTTKTGHPDLQAFQTSDQSYYFARQLSLNDDVFLEKDYFELSRIIEMYFKSVEIDSFTLEEDTYLSRPRLMGFGQLSNGKPIALSMMIKGGHYYLMGSCDISIEKSKSYFNSFKYTKMNYDKPFTEVVDTNLHYKVKAPRKADDNVQQRNRYSNTKRKDYESVTKHQVFNSISKQQVFLKYHKYNTYTQYENMDSLWQAILDYKVKLGLVIEAKKTGLTVSNDPYLDIVVADTATLRRIKFKYIIHGGVQYKLSAVLDSLTLNADTFVNSIFNTFQPLDTLIGISPIEKKSHLFFEHLYAEEDSLNTQVLNHFGDIKFGLDDKDLLIKTIETWPFKDKDLTVKKYLISAFSNFKTEDRLHYLIKWYSVFDDNADIQIHILNLLSKDGTKQSYKQIGSFIASDIPLPYKEYKINTMFYNLDKHPDLEAEITDYLTNLLSVKEYKSSVLKTLSTLYKEDIIGKRFLKKYKKILIALTKVELKRARSQQIANSHNKNANLQYKDLNHLLHILLAFRNDDEVKLIYDKIKISNFTNEYTRLLANQLKIRSKVEREEIERIAKDLTTRAFMYKEFSDHEILDLYPEQYASIDSIAKSDLSNTYLKSKDDRLEFYQKRDIIKENVNYTIIYYKYFTSGYQDKKVTKMVYTILSPENYSVSVKMDVIDDEFREDFLEIIRNEEERFILDNHPRVVFSNNSMQMRW